jgi:hypothetical protein
MSDQEQQPPFVNVPMIEGPLHVGAGKCYTGHAVAVRHKGLSFIVVAGDLDTLNGVWNELGHAVAPMRVDLTRSVIVAPKARVSKIDQ